MAFTYTNNSLMLDNFDVSEFCQAQNQACYLYDVDEIVKRLALFKQDLPKPQSIHYAMKANSNQFILKTIAELGYGADVVSGGELKLAMSSGFKAENIVFSGVGKTRKEIELALNSNIKQINVESPQELLRIADIAEKNHIKAPIALRMNPDVDPDTHPYIKTGFRDNKFGMDASFLPELKSILKDKSKYLNLKGLTIHIGSQIVDLNSFKDAIEKTKLVFNELKHAGFEMTTFDVGGGLGMSKGLPAKGDDKLKEVMSNHWVEFAHNGKVKGWEPYDASLQRFMEYGQAGKHGMTVDTYMNERFALLEEANLIGAKGEKLARIKNTTEEVAVGAKL